MQSSKKKLEKERLERLKDFLNGKNVGPFTLDIKPTNRCNLDCIFCPTKVEYEKLDKKELTDEQYIYLIEQAAKLNIREVYISGGGEPLIRKELLIKLMKMIKRNRMRGILITNGTLFGKEDIKNIVEVGWDDIFFSIDGTTSNTNDYLRAKKGAFKEAVNSLTLFKKTKKLLGKEKPILHISTVLVNKNYKELPDLIELLKEYDIESLFLQKFIPWSEESSNLKLNSKQNKELLIYFDKAKILSQKYNIATNIIDFENVHFKKIDNNENKESFCTMPFLYFCIRVDGVIQPCMSKSDFIVGDVTKNTIKEIWFGRNMTGFRKSLLNGKEYNFCKNCCAKTTNRELENFRNKKNG